MGGGFLGDRRQPRLRVTLSWFYSPAHWLIFSGGRFCGKLRLPLPRSALEGLKQAARAGYWSARLGGMGKGVIIEPSVLIRHHPERVFLGDYSYLDSYVELWVDQPIKIGRYVHMAQYSYIQSGAEVTIGDYAGIAAGVLIYGASNTYRTPEGKEKTILLSMSGSAPPDLQYVYKAPVFIDEYAFIGTNSVVLPGVRIGRGAVIGASSVVTEDIPPYTIAVGIPARPIKKREIPPSELGRLQSSEEASQQ